LVLSDIYTLSLHDALPIYQIRPIVLDHCDDRALIDAEVVGVEPPDAGNDAAVLRRSSNESRIEIIYEPVIGKKIVAVFFAHRDQCGNRDLRRKRHRSTRGGRCDCTIVSYLGGRRAARSIRPELSRAPIDDERRIKRTITCRQTPKVSAVAGKLSRIVDRVRPL